MPPSNPETFTERFNRLTRGLSRKKIGQILDLTDGAVRKLQDGTTQTLKAHAAIALAAKVGVPVEYLSAQGPLAPLEPSLSGEGATLPKASSLAEMLSHLPEGQPKKVLQELNRQLFELQLIVAEVHPEAIQEDLRQAFGLKPSDASPKKPRGRRVG